MSLRSSGRGFRAFYAGLAALLFVAFSLAACGGTATVAPGQKVNLTFWNFNTLQQSTVDAFNKTHPLIHVTMNVIPAGNLYTKLENGIKAGNAPDITRVEYYMLPTIEATGGLVDISKYGAASLQNQFVPWTWSQVTRGSAIYALPMDTGPMALAYRSDIFQKYNLTPPTTWNEYAQDAAILHAADPKLYITDFQYGMAFFASLAWQAGGRWFGINGNSWKVSINDAGSKMVAGYWQNLISNHLVGNAATSTPQTETDATQITAAWNTKYIASGNPQQAGLWRVAPLPQWVAGQQTSANEGGSTNAVTTSSKYPEQAAEFVKWISTDHTALVNQVNAQKIFPSTTAGLSLSPLHLLNSYYGQTIADVFTTASKHIDTSFTWGPNMLTVTADFGDMAQQVVAGKTTLSAGLDTLQAKTVAELKQLGFSVQQ